MADEEEPVWEPGSWLVAGTLGLVCMQRWGLLSKLDKATTAIVLSIAEGNGRFTGTDQAKFFGIAYRSTVQSASLVDLATAKGPADVSRVDQGRELLRRIAAMLTSLSKVAAHNA